MPKVLLIDDSEPDLLFTRLMLERTGTAGEVITFESARDALEMLRAPRPPDVDLILLDINLPGMDGFAFLDAYTRLPVDGVRRPHVVMLTSSPDPSDRQRAMSHACVKGYVVKPIDAAGLAEVARLAAA